MSGTRIGSKDISILWVIGLTRSGNEPQAFHVGSLAPFKVSVHTDVTLMPPGCKCPIKKNVPECYQLELSSLFMMGWRRPYCTLHYWSVSPSRVVINNNILRTLRVVICGRIEIKCLWGIQIIGGMFYHGNIIYIDILYIMPCLIWLQNTWEIYSQRELMFKHCAPQSPAS